MVAYSLGGAAKGEQHPPVRYPWTLDYDDRKTTTKAIQIDQAAYSATAKRRYAYLGWWAGSEGKGVYSALQRLEAFDE